jgi:hypothetical protein
MKNKDTPYTRNFFNNAEEMENSILDSSNDFDPKIKSYFQNAVDVACNLLANDNDMTLEKEKETWRMIKEKERERLDAVLSQTSGKRVTPSRAESVPTAGDVISQNRKNGKSSSKVMDLKYATPESSNQVVQIDFVSNPKTKSATPTANSNTSSNDERNHKCGQAESIAQIVTTLKNNDGNFLKPSSMPPPIGLANHLQDESSKYIGDQEIDDAAMKSVESERSHSVCGSTISLQPGEPWSSVWGKMYKKGWKYVNGNLQYSNFYVKPGKTKIDGEFNVDYFCLEGAKKYMKNHYYWIEDYDLSKSDEHDDLVLEHREPWKSVWSKFRAKGWKYLSGNLEHTYFYVKPGKNKKDGQFGVDYFGEYGVQKYARDNYGWIDNDTSDESAASDAELVLEHGEPWKSVWSKLTARGWKYLSGNLEHTYFYVKPGKNKKNGQFGVDYFGEDGVQKYVKENYGWIDNDTSDRSKDSTSIESNKNDQTDEEVDSDEQSENFSENMNDSENEMEEDADASSADSGESLVSDSGNVVSETELSPGHESESAISEIGEFDEWPVVWKKLRENGWTWNYGSLESEYFRPGQFDNKSGTEGKDWFSNLASVKKYISRCFGWHYDEEIFGRQRRKARQQTLDESRVKKRKNKEQTKKVPKDSNRIWGKEKKKRRIVNVSTPPNLSPLGNKELECGSASQSYRSYSRENLPWWRSQPIPDYHDIILPLLKLFDYYKSGKYILPNGKTFQSLEELRCHCCRYGFPKTSLLDESQMKIMDRWISLCKLPKRFNGYQIKAKNSIELFSDVPVVTSNEAVDRLCSCFGCSKKDDGSFLFPRRSFRDPVEGRDEERKFITFANIKELMLYLCAYGLTAARDCMEADYFAILLWAGSSFSSQKIIRENQVDESNTAKTSNALDGIQNQDVEVIKGKSNLGLDSSDNAVAKSEKIDLIQEKEKLNVLFPTHGDLDMNNQEQEVNACEPKSSSTLESAPYDNLSMQDVSKKIAPSILQRSSISKEIRQSKSLTVSEPSKPPSMNSDPGDEGPENASIAESPAQYSKITKIGNTQQDDNKTSIQEEIEKEDQIQVLPEKASLPRPASLSEKRSNHKFGKSDESTEAVSNKHFRNEEESMRCPSLEKAVPIHSQPVTETSTVQFSTPNSNLESPSTQHSPTEDSASKERIENSCCQQGMTSPSDVNKESRVLTTLKPSDRLAGSPMKQVREDIKDQSDMNPFDSLITQVATDANLDHQQDESKYASMPPTPDHDNLDADQTSRRVMGLSSGMSILELSPPYNEYSESYDEASLAMHSAVEGVIEKSPSEKDLDTFFLTQPTSEEFE